MHKRFFYLFLNRDEGWGRERERGRNISVRVKHHLAASWVPHTKDRAHNLCHLRNNPQVHRTASKQLSHIGYGSIYCIYNINMWALTNYNYTIVFFSSIISQLLLSHTPTFFQLPLYLFEFDKSCSRFIP